MKTFWILTLFAALFTQTASAKNTNVSFGPFTSIAPGINMGLGFASARLRNPDIAVSSNTGFIIGGNVELGITDIFFVQPEINYIEKGFEFVSTIANTVYTQKYNYNYLSIPVLAKLKLDTGKFKPVLLAGPEFAFLINANYNENTQNPIGQRNVDIYGSSRGFELGFVLGIGGEYGINDELAANLNIRYDHGLTNINRSPSNSSYSSEVRNSSTQVLIGISYKL